MEFKYYVIKFADIPSTCADSLVCVPRSWIKILLDREAEKWKVVVSYPIEESQKTRRRVENEEPCDRSWKHFWATVEYTTDDYQDAERWITLGTVDPKDNTNVGYAHIGIPSVEAIRKASAHYQQNVTSTTHETIPQATGVPMKNHPSIKLSLKRNLQSNNADDFYIKQLRIDSNSGREKIQQNYLSKPSVQSRKTVSTHQGISNKERVQQKVPPAPVTHGRCQSDSYRMAMQSTGQETTSCHNRYYQPPCHLSQNCGKPDVKKSNELSFNGTKDNQAVVNSAPQTVTSSPRQLCQLSGQASQKRISVVPNEYLFQNQGRQDRSNERFVNTNTGDGRPYPVITNTQSVNYPSSQFCQSSQCRNKIPVLVDPNNHVIQDSHIDGRTNSHISNTPSAAQALKILMTQRDEPRDGKHENQILTTHKNLLYQASPKQEIHGKAQEVYHIYPDNIPRSNLGQPTLSKYTEQLNIKEHLSPHIVYSDTLHTSKHFTSSADENISSQYILRNGLGANQNSSDYTHRSCQLVEQLHQKRDAAGYNVHVHINKIVVAKSNNIEQHTNIPPLQNFTKNISSYPQNTSSFLSESTHPLKKSHQTQDSPEYKVVVQQHPLINKIIITKSTEMDTSTEIPSSQCDTLIAGENSLHIIEDCQSTERPYERQFSIDPAEYPPQDPNVPKKIIRTTSAGIPYIVNDYFPENVKNPPPKTNSEAHTYQLSKPSNDSTDSQSYSTPVLPAEIIAGGKTPTTDRFDQRPRLQSIRKHKLGEMSNMSSIPVKRIPRFTERLHGKQSLPISNNHLPHNLNRGPQFERQSAKINNHQNFKVTSSNMDNPPNLSHQPNRTPAYIQENQFVPAYYERSFQDTRIPESYCVNPARINDTNQRIQTMAENSTIVHDGFNTAQNACCSCKCTQARQIRTSVQNCHYSTPQMPQTFVRRSTEAHNRKPNMQTQTNREYEPICNESSNNTADQPSASQAFENPKQEHFLTVVEAPLAQDTNSQDILSTAYIDSNNSKVNSGVTLVVTQKSPSANQLSQDLTDSTLSQNCNIVPNEFMPPEEIYLGDNANISCGQINAAEMASTSNQNVSNADNLANPIPNTEHAYINDFQNIIQKIESNLSETFTLFENANKMLNDYAATFKKTLKVIKDYHELKLNEAASSASMNGKKAKDKRHKRKRHEKSSSDDVHDDNHSNHNN